MAENTNGKGNSNKYIGDLKVFEDLLLMSDEEIEKERRSAQELIEMHNGLTPEVRKLKEELAEIDAKPVLTGIERVQKAEKEKRYNEITSDLEYQAQKAKIESIVNSEKFIDELKRYTIFLKVRDSLTLAEAVIIDSRNKRAEKLKVARTSLNEAKAKDREEKAKIDNELSELEEYFEEYTKRPYLSEEDRIEYEEKKKSQKELIDAKASFPSKEVMDAKANVEEILRNSEESKKIINAKNQIKFMTDRSNWNQILTMSKEELKDFLNEKETAVAPKQAPTQDAKKEQNGEAKDDAKNEEEQGKKEGAGKDKKETPVRTGGAPVVSSGTHESEELGEGAEEAEGENEEERPEKEPKDLTDPKRSLWERFKGLFSRDKEKKRVRKPKRQKITRKIRKEKQDKIYKKYIENYKTMYKQEPGLIDKAMAKIAPNFFAQVRNVIEYKEPINPEDHKGTQAEELAAKVDEKGQELERVEGEIVALDQKSGITYEGTQAQGLAEKVAASKKIGENPWNRTSRYTERMNVWQFLDHVKDLQTIDEYHEKKLNPVVRVDTDYRDDFSEEPKRVEAVIKGGMDEKEQSHTILEEMQQLKQKQIKIDATEEEVITRQNMASAFRKQVQEQGQVIRPEDMKKPGIATYGIKAGKPKGQKLDLRNIVDRANEAAKVKVAEAKGEAPKTTSPEHGDGDR